MHGHMNLTYTQVFLLIHTIHYCLLSLIAALIGHKIFHELRTYRAYLVELFAAATFIRTSGLVCSSPSAGLVSVGDSSM